MSDSNISKTFPIQTFNTDLTLGWNTNAVAVWAELTDSSKQAIRDIIREELEKLLQSQEKPRQEQESSYFTCAKCGKRHEDNAPDWHGYVEQKPDQLDRREWAFCSKQHLDEWRNGRRSKTS